MTRFEAMYEILHFGKEEEKKLLMEGKRHEAYQIEQARNTLMYFLNENSIKRVYNKIKLMTEYFIDNNGFWHYEKEFVTDEYTRNLLLELKKKFIL